ncbi:hypothetical protein DPMN_107884 [Dreissena polymorpha]|uniref:Uncharacterized protein n=1 Tax=Dreissena polymorpha TaxID=45954 RepID=A0A9D4QKL0_DREPO|nr:hypothetical protein DPMN_107884 [Dreissena polymorpha]
MPVCVFEIYLQVAQRLLDYRCIDLPLLCVVFVLSAQEVLVGVRAGYRGRPDSRGATGREKRERERERGREREIERERDRAEIERAREREIEKSSRSLRR